MEFINNINVQFYLLAYFIGGIPFGYLIARFFGGVDIRKSGSGSIGATNVLRVLSQQKDSIYAKKAATATLILDASKGMLLIIAGMLIGLDYSTLWAIALFSVIGHCFSPYLMFEGGKGVATAFGSLLVLLPIPTLIGLAGWLVAAKVFKISSISSLVGLCLGVFSAFILYSDVPMIGSFAPLLLITFIVLYKHIPNLFRLFTQKEQPVV